MAFFFDVKQEAGHKVKVTMVWLLKNELNWGIYLNFGNLTKIGEFENRINCGEIDFLKTEKIENVASLPKLWAQQIPGAIINKKLTDSLIALGNQESAMTIVDQIDEVSKTSLMYLVGFLKKLSLSSEVTKMTIDNLAMVFEPEDARPMVSGMISKRTNSLLNKLMNKWDASSVQTQISLSRLIGYLGL